MKLRMEGLRIETQPDAEIIDRALRAAVWLNPQPNRLDRAKRARCTALAKRFAQLAESNRRGDFPQFLGIEDTRLVAEASDAAVHNVQLATDLVRSVATEKSLDFDAARKHIIRHAPTDWAVGALLLDAGRPQAAAELAEVFAGAEGAPFALAPLAEAA